MIPPYRYRRGSSPLVVSMPHVGTFIPPSIARDLEDVAAQRPDTDWHLPRLYDFLADLDATLVAATHSRYVVDLNRPPDDASLYPGQDTTGLLPVDTFDRRLLYKPGREPNARALTQRVARHWAPYHRRLARELERTHAEHGIAILWDAHSIVSVAPRFFAGRLPDFNLGTAGGAACDPALSGRLAAVLERHSRFTSVLDGRFKGGHITRRYGRPAHGVHAIQMEMAEALYMDEVPPWTFREERARAARTVLRELLESVLQWAADRPRSP